MRKKVKNKKGNILLTSMLLLIAFSLIVAVGVAITAIDSLNLTLDYLLGEKADYFAEGCLEESLLGISRDFSYSGGTFIIEDGECNIVVSGTGNSRTIQATGTVENYTSKIQVDLDLSSQPYNISNWQKGF